MSASDKKKLRAAERAEKLTEKQQAEQKEAKKLKIMTVTFVAILALMVVFAVYTGIDKTIEGKGIRENKTVAVTIGEHEITNAELSYYYIDNINNFMNNYGSYAALFGLDTTKPLDKQYVDEATGKTWADDFIDTAILNVQSVYALNDAAKAAGFELTDDQKTYIDSILVNVKSSAMLYYGYTDLETYLKAMYGNGATEENYRQYVEMNYIADAYQAAYSESLTYDDADIRAEEAKNFNAYSSYSYNYYYLNGANFDSLKAAEESAKILTADDIDSVEALDAAIAALPVNAESESAASIASKDVAYSSISSVYAEWVTDADRKAGDITYIPYNYTSTDDEGNETTELRGYYVVMFNGCNDNISPMANVRHILVGFEGGTYDSTTGVTTYTDEEKQAAKLEAEEIYNEWKNGAANEDSFAALANEKSDDGNGTTGGLYENINPSTNFVTNFKNWALAERKAGDTEIVETEYGYHIMFYCGDSTQTYRDYMIENTLRNVEVSEWYNALIEATTAETGDMKYIHTDLILSGN